MKKEIVNWNNWNKKSNNFKKYSDIKSNLIYGKLLDKIPDVSIVIITYKRAVGLKRAIDSALNQNFEFPYEIIVCDDSGYDKATDELMKKYCKSHKNIVYYRHEKNLGQYANWNRACELCRTDWYCLLHDDDIIKPDYLKTMFKFCKIYKNAGLIGNYMDTFNFDSEKITNSKIDKLVNAFIKIRRGKPIKLTLQDNIKHIYVSSCCLFINRKKAIEIGGLDDLYFPSSDFAFDAKMNYYYTSYFLPLKLSLRGVGNNESLKQNVCDDSIKCAYKQTFAMCKTLGYSDKKAKRKASYAAVVSEIGVKGYNDVDYGKVKDKLKIKKIYNNKLIILLINLHSKISWGLLLFRRTK